MPENLQAGERALSLDSLVALTVEVVPGCEQAGVSLCVDRASREVRTPAATSPVVLEVDHLQYVHDEGPCLSALWTDGVYLSRDIGSDERWPLWGPPAADLGLRSVLSARLDTGPGVLAALNLYAADTAAFDAVDRQLIVALASYAGQALAAAHRVGLLETALDSRHTIGLAQGRLMQRYGMDPDQAFQVMVRHSQTSNTKLRVVASRIVLEGVEFLPGD